MVSQGIARQIRLDLVFGLRAGRLIAPEAPRGTGAADEREIQLLVELR